MAPLRKKETPSKTNSYAIKPPSRKIVLSPIRTRNRKRKLSDLLGPQWTKEELQRFYKAYRKSGKAWAKVAEIVETRTTAMVEALFTMNRAYLSLPRNHASVAGLIAMMTDYYSNLGESDDELDTNRPFRGVEISGRNAFLTNHYSPERDGFSFLKKMCHGRRTPRVPVSFSSHENGENRSSVRRGLIMNGGSLDEFVAQERVVTFKEPSQRGGSDETSSLPIETLTLVSLSNSGERAQNETQNGGHPNKTKPRKNGSKSVVLKEIKEACSGTDEGLIPAKDKRNLRAKGIKATFISRSNKVLFADDKVTSFHALQTLADLSSRLPPTGGDHLRTSKPTEQESSPSITLSTLSKDKCEADFKRRGSRKRKRQHDATIDKVKVVNPKNGEGGKMLRSLSSAAIKMEPFVPTKGRSKRKSSISKPSFGSDKSPQVDNESVTETKPLANCLSLQDLRRWCKYEWMYSSIDHPWFHKREFVEYLDHVGLGHVPKLARVEWGVIKSSLGKPRRFSEKFLTEEKEKLNQYRDSVRNHYSNLRSGNLKGLPADLARPLTVGQKVIALHPGTGEPHNGCVLTVDHSACRVLFDLPDHGVSLVSDVDCMPWNPAECCPASVSRIRFPIKPAANESQIRFVDRKVFTQKEADVHAIAELTRALRKKEVVVALLKRMNEERTRDRKGSEQMKKQYAAVILKLNEVNEQVTSALTGLRQRNTYRAVDSGAHVVETLKALRAKAQSMVGATGRAEDDGSALAIDRRLIVNCVAAFLMIQTCTERLFPPSDVAEIIDCAISSLKPACSVNIPVYCEIQKSMGIIKNQILALIPS